MVRQASYEMTPYTPAAVLKTNLHHQVLRQQVYIRRKSQPFPLLTFRMGRRDVDILLELLSGLLGRIRILPYSRIVRKSTAFEGLNCCFTNYISYIGLDCVRDVLEVSL